MRIYTKGAFEWNNTTQRYEATNESEYYEYEGDIALCKGEGGGGGSQSSTTVQTQEPWDVQIPYLTRGFEEAKKLFLDNPPPSFYPGPTTTPYSPEKETALQLQTMRAATGSPLQPLSNVQAIGTLGGAYLPSQNPYNTTLNEEFEDPSNNFRFGQAMGSATRKIMPAVDSAFERSGRFNSGLAQTAKTQAIADAFADMYLQDKGMTMQDRQMRGQNYSNERENMMRSLMAAPSLMNQDYVDFAQLGQVGDIRDSLNQQKTAENVNRYDYAQNIMQNQLLKYMPLVSGSFGGTTTSNTNGTTQTQQPQSNGFSSGLGGAMAGYKLASGIGGVNPILGAGVGLLSGFF